MSSRKRSRTSEVFEAIEDLNSEDLRADRRHKRVTSKDLARSAAARSQTKLHGQLMECRILLQRVLNSITSSDAPPQETKQACNRLLAQLLEARKKMVSDEESRDAGPNYAEAVQSEDELSRVLQSEYIECRDEWKETLNRRHKDLRLHAGLTAKSQFRVMDSSFWQQVDATVSHEELRLQAKGEEKEYFFDDSKVYQQMLQDFVLSAGSGGEEAAAAQRLRRAMKQSKNTKKEVDRRASKGRKIRYNVIPKLTNFTFPKARPVPTSVAMDEDEWFRSLFGGAAKQKR